MREKILVWIREGSMNVQNYSLGDLGSNFLWEITYIAWCRFYFFWIRQYPYNSLTFARHNILADNFVYTICVMVKDKRMIILYAIIYCDQPLFTLYFSFWEILRGFCSPFHSLYPFHPSLSLSLSNLYISPSTFLSLSINHFLWCI